MTKQLAMFEYWEEQDDDWMEDPRLKSPLDMVEEYAALTKQHANPDLYYELIEEELDEFYDAEVGVKELKELADCIYVLYGYAYNRGWDLDEAVRRVHENNMSRMYQPDGTIKRREDGKIMKNKDYPAVELGDLV